MRLQILLIPFIFVTALPILATAQAPVHRNPFYQGSAWTLPHTPLLLNRYAVTPDTGRAPPTHWAEGAIVGSVGLGAAFGFLGYEFCHNLNESASTSCTSEAFGGALLGAAIGFVVGGLVGGAFPKDK